MKGRILLGVLLLGGLLVGLVNAAGNSPSAILTGTLPSLTFPTTSGRHDTEEGRT